jgi:signal transduction histidine kinase
VGRGGAFWLRHVIYANSVAGSIATAQSQALAIASTYDTPAARVNADAGALARSRGDCDIESDPAHCRYDKWYEFPYYGMGISFAVVDDHGKVLLAQNQLAYYVRESGLTFPTSPAQSNDTLFGRVDVLLRPAASGRQGQLDGREVTLVTYKVSPSAEPKDAKATVYLLISPTDAEAAVAPVDEWLRRGLPAAIVFVAAVAWWAAGRALRPVERMRAELARITAADMSSRVPRPDTGDEIARLAVTMNATLDRLADAAERQRRFVADAAHELRSPLAGLRNTVEVALEHGAAADLNAVKSTTERLQRLTDDLLLLARLERTAPATGKPVDLAAVAEELAGERCYRVRYARDRITVTVTKPEPRWVRVEVRDDGPGIPAADRERIFERFARVDEARDRGHGGAGLGLAIARDIAVRHGGSLYAAGPVDGACFVAELPQARRT